MGVEVVGLPVGVDVIGLFVGTLVGFEVVGLDVGFEVVGLEVHPISVDGTGKHVLFRQVFVVQLMKSLHPASLMQGSSAFGVLRHTIFTRDESL